MSVPPASLTTDLYLARAEPEPPLPPAPAPASVPVAPALPEVQLATSSPGSVAEDLSAVQPRIHRAMRAFTAATGFRRRVKGSAIQRLHNNTERLEAAELRMADFGPEQWSKVQALVDLDRELSATQSSLQRAALTRRSAAGQLQSPLVGGYGPKARAHAQVLLQEAAALEAAIAEVRLQRAELHQADPVAAVLAQHPEADSASIEAKMSLVQSAFGAIKFRMVRVRVQIEEGRLDPLDLSLVVSAQLEREQISAHAISNDLDAQAILRSLDHHQVMSSGRQLGGAVLVGGLSAAGLLLGGGVALVAGLAGAVDGIQGYGHAARLEGAHLAASAGGAELVDGAAAHDAYVFAQASLLLTAFDVLEVAGAARGLVQAHRLRKLYGASEAMEGLSASQVKQVHVWMRQRTTGQGAQAARTHRKLTADLGADRLARVETALGQVVKGLSSGRAQALRHVLGEEVFSQLGARFGGDKVSAWTRAHGAERVRAFAQALPLETAAKLLSDLPPTALARLEPLTATELADLAARVPLDLLEQTSRVLDGATLRTLADRFGDDLPRVLKAAHPGDWADPEVLRTLAGANRAAVLEVLGRATRPQTLSRVLNLAKRHVDEAKLSIDVDLPAQLLSYLRTRPPAEAEAAAQMLAAELKDHGHAILRHGPQVPDAALRHRLKTGTAPDGSQSAGHWAATRFRSFRVMARSREAVWVALKKVEAVDTSFGPGVRGNPSEDFFVVTVEHGRGTSRGVFSTSAPTVVPRPNSPGRTVNRYGQAVDSAEYLTRTQAKVVWEDGRWQVKQHFPGVKDFDKPSKVYSRDALITLREPK